MLAACGDTTYIGCMLVIIDDYRRTVFSFGQLGLVENSCGTREGMGDAPAVATCGRDSRENRVEVGAVLYP